MNKTVIKIDGIENLTINMGQNFYSSCNIGECISFLHLPTVKGVWFYIYKKTPNEIILKKCGWYRSLICKISYFFRRSNY